MAIKRYELSEVQWVKIASLLPGKISDPGRSGSDNRLFINGCLWVLRSGAHCATCRIGMASGRRCINVSAAGATLA
jgi:transposase